MSAHDLLLLPIRVVALVVGTMTSSEFIAKWRSSRLRRMRRRSRTSTIWAGCPTIRCRRKPTRRRDFHFPGGRPTAASGAGIGDGRNRDHGKAPTRRDHVRITHSYGGGRTRRCTPFLNRLRRFAMLIPAFELGDCVGCLCRAAMRS